MGIGNFSKASRLSLKALRLYDALGLLSPAKVDEESGYRYYHESQLAPAGLIVMLRRLDMPLDTIAEVLARSGTEAAGVLHGYWREVEDAATTKRKLVGHIDRLLKGEIEIMHEVLTRQVGEQKLLSIEKRTLADALPRVIEENGGKLIQHALDRGVTITGPMLVIYHGVVTMDADGPVEVCVPVAGAVEPFGEARVRIEPAHRQAFARITKAQVAFPEILSAYESVEAWLRQHGKTMAGSPREVYFAAWATTVAPAQQPLMCSPNDGS